MFFWIWLFPWTFKYNRIPKIQYITFSIKTYFFNKIKKKKLEIFQAKNQRILKIKIEKKNFEKSTYELWNAFWKKAINLEKLLTLGKIVNGITKFQYIIFSIKIKYQLFIIETSNTFG